MLAEGYSLNMIERTLSAAPEAAGSATLALHRALLAPWLPPQPEETTAAELAARAGIAEDDRLVGGLVALGLVERLDEGRLRVLDPALLTARLQVGELGGPPPALPPAGVRGGGGGGPPAALIEAQLAVTEHVREIAQTYVRMFVETGWKPLAEGGATPEQLERAQTTVARLQPAAAQALLASFRREMAAAVEVAVDEELRKLGEG